MGERCVAYYFGRELKAPDKWKRENEADSENVIRRKLTDMERAVVMEISIAKNCLDNIRYNVVGAHAIVLSVLLSVSLVSFLQPPGGFTDEGHIQNSLSTRVICYLFFTLASMYIDCVALIYFLHCIYTGVWSLDSSCFTMVDNINAEVSEREVDYLHGLRFRIRCIMLPTIFYRTVILLCFVYASILLSAVCFFISSAISLYPLSTSGMILIALGFFFMVTGCYMSMMSFFGFENRFHEFWEDVVCMPEPPLLPLQGERWRLQHAYIHWKHGSNIYDNNLVPMTNLERN